jgi:hypothetical protein
MMACIAISKASLAVSSLVTEAVRLRHRPKRYAVREGYKHTGHQVSLQYITVPKVMYHLGPYRSSILSFFSPLVAS